MPDVATHLEALVQSIRYEVDPGVVAELYRFLPPRWTWRVVENAFVVEADDEEIEWRSVVGRLALALAYRNGSVLRELRVSGDIELATWRASGKGFRVVFRSPERAPFE